MMGKETLWLIAIFLARGDAFSASRWITIPSPTKPEFSVLTAVSSGEDSKAPAAVLEARNSSDPLSTARPPCVYRSPSLRGQWTPRIELSDLEIGQELSDAVIVQELLDGKTGPKLFVDCGVGRYKTGKKKKGWKIQTAMLRLPRSNKKSVTAKRAGRLRKKPYFTVYVSRIRLSIDQLEVCLKPEDVDKYKSSSRLKSASKLQPGDECVGTVRRVEPYGVLVGLDGINRPGLLHIQKVADLYGHYIDKVEGLIEAGLERGARIKVQVESNQSKRLFLDFTDDVKATARDERNQKEKQAASKKHDEVKPASSTESVATVSTTTTTETSEYSAIDSDDDPYAEYAEWASQMGPARYEEDTGDGYDDYDEDRDIEDALGLGSY